MEGKCNKKKIRLYSSLVTIQIIFQFLSFVCDEKKLKKIPKNQA